MDDSDCSEEITNDNSIQFSSDYIKTGYDHHSLPSLNFDLHAYTPLNVNQKYVTEYETASYKYSLPVPVTDPLVLKKRLKKETDHVTDLVCRKKFWERGRDDLISRNLKVNGVLKCSTNSEANKKINFETLQLVNHLEQDPDPSFSGFYNWYYTDGCLNNIFFNNVNSIIYNHPNNRGTCCVSPFLINKHNCAYLDGASLLKTGHKRLVYQIAVSNDIIAIRQKQFTTLFRIVDDKELNFKKIHQHFETANSIASVSISNVDSKYCSLTTSHTLKLWDPELKDDCLNWTNLTSNKCRSIDNWGSVKYMSDHDIIISTRSTVFLKDTRCSLEQTSRRWKIPVNKLPCNHICMIIKSNSRNGRAYVATTHNLYELDFRNGWSKQWTHMMKLPPMYGVVNPESGGNETLFIANQNSNEICAIDTNLQVMPQFLPSLENVRNKLNLKGLCLDPLIYSRFNACTTGLAVIPYNTKNNSCSILRHSSLGDIFCQNRKYEYDDISQDKINYKHFVNWENQFNKPIDSLNRAPLKVTSVIKFHQLYDVMKESNENLLKKLSKNTKKRSIKEVNSLKKKWKSPDLRFLHPSDELGQDLAKVWKIEETSDDPSQNGQDSEENDDELNLDEDSHDEDHNQSLEVNNIEDNADSVDKVDDFVPTTEVSTPSRSSIQVGKLYNEYQNIFSNSSSSMILGNDILYMSEFYENNESYVTPNIAPKKKIVTNAKRKSKFSGGF